MYENETHVISRGDSGLQSCQEARSCVQSVVGPDVGCVRIEAEEPELHAFDADRRRPR